MALLDLKEVRFSYEPEAVEPKEALRGVTLQIEQGEFVALLGHNGCGKSTVAKLLNGMLVPTSGKVLVDGIDTAEEARQLEVRRRVGLVQQNPDNQLVAGVVEEDVAFGPENLGIPPLEIRERVDAALRAVDMYEYRESAPHKLSGGQKQRVAIAGIIAMETACIVLDEPTAMLDPRGRGEVMETIKRLNREKGITIVLITHYMEEAVQAGRVVVMDQGAVLTDGSPEEVFGKVEFLKRHGLDVPQATELVYRLSTAGAKLSGMPLGTERCVELFRRYREQNAAEVELSKQESPSVFQKTSREGGKTVLETKELTYEYGAGTPFRKTALDHASISIRQGEFLGVIGHTGSGKSTLIQLLNGLLKPTAGQVILEGRDIWAEPKKIRDVRFQVGMVFQYPEYQLFEETVLKDIMFGPKNMGLSEEQAKARALEAARFTGLSEELLEKSPFELSGGEKRRAAIAGVIAMDPDVLVLDEPTAGLDPRGRDVLLSQISQYHKERHNTVLLVSHSMEDIGRTADRLLVMNRGQVVLLEDTRTVFSQGEKLEQIGLRVPQITRIMQELEAMGYPADPATLTVDEALKQLLPVFQGGRTQPVQKGGPFV